MKLARLRAAATPKPYYSIADPGTWVSVASIISLIVFDGFGVADPSGDIKLGILIGCSILLGSIALAKHLLTFQTLLADLVALFQQRNATLEEGATVYHVHELVTPSGERIPVRDDRPTRPAGLRGRLPVKAPAERFPIRYVHEYLGALPPVTYPIDVSGGITAWEMLGNGPDPTLTVHGGQPVGDCVFAARQHYKMTQAQTAGVLATEGWESTDELVTEYLAFGHGQDAGANIADALLAWYKAGLILGFAPVDLSNRQQADAVMATFDGLLCGVSLTPDADALFTQGKPWTVADGQQPDPEEGHAIVQTKATAPASGIDTFVTWGAEQDATTDWTGRCREEAWAVIFPETKIHPEALAAMQRDIDALGGTRQEARIAAPLAGASV